METSGAILPLNHHASSRVSQQKAVKKVRNYKKYVSRLVNVMEMVTENDW